ncbi:rRNA maturation RNase YbeY [Arthrobacter sp. MYb211]|uniref:rRNA maturation RNase YbeY n=1 Tax=Micrococcaceae TaxID=1268 RepID=UPI000BB6AE0D|nr:MULTISPECIES: rRNA maturation RNase YbeY [Micrococcaceae]PCC29108.1 rRNA maturation RNase YbeY [Glutamicibacter sp. BW80]PRA01128.1 rRNA maturation RNase YbeY [Arthrobacter sp. MYb224]PRA06705.1 rRNA maturation RNase YbeY [Arthrobacter sp. MYb229]PRA13851.1 rRNA maturation RNase YbeY [Arthrobacter sp. MYb221]PRB53606.1 rRNA maturation RNase YbeY [Arthrobacter sp. MYb216]
MSVEVNNETDYEVDLQDVQKLADSITQAMFIHPETEVSVVFIDEEAMSELHVEWMDLEGPTDVMSFPMDELRPGSEKAPSESGILGDIVICPTVAEAQAKAGGHPVHDEILLLTTHGMLHLMGFDHDEPAEKAEMFGLQRRLLESYTGRPAPKETVE